MRNAPQIDTSGCVFTLLQLMRTLRQRAIVCNYSLDHRGLEDAERFWHHGVVFSASRYAEHASKSRPSSHPPSPPHLRPNTLVLLKPDGDEPAAVTHAMITAVINTSVQTESGRKQPESHRSFQFISTYRHSFFPKADSFSQILTMLLWFYVQTIMRRYSFIIIILTCY